MLGEIGAKLQAKGTDENRILDHKSPYGKNSTYGPLADCVRTGRLGMAPDWRQERLALIVGRKMIHPHKRQQYEEEDAPISGLGPSRETYL